MSGAHKQADFRKLNPMGKLPALIDGETVVTESAAIALYQKLGFQTHSLWLTKGL